MQVLDGNTIQAIAIFAGVGFIIIASIGLVFKAFGTHWGWGLAVLFIPFGVIGYIVKHWADAKGILGAWLTGVGLLMVPTASAMLSDRSPMDYAQETINAFLNPDTQVENLTSMEAEKKRLAKMKESLKDQYEVLDRNDSEAVASFNRAIEAYKQRKRVYEQKRK